MTSIMSKFENHPTVIAARQRDYGPARDEPEIEYDPALKSDVNPHGIVRAKVDNVTTQLGTITLSMFTNEAGLESLGDNLYRETEASGTATDTNPSENGAGTLSQNFLEGSNVDSIESITRLITAQRAYELNSRVISTADEMLNTLSQLR
jgi:flagellar basal-body rod protein FlgG